MKKVNPYKTQQTINLTIGIIGLIGTAGLIGEVANFWNFGLEGFGLAPILIVNLFQYFQFKKAYFNFSEEKIEWSFLGMEESKSFSLDGNSVTFETNWKGIIVHSGDKTYEISLDGIWKRERKRIISEMKVFYVAA